MYLFIISREKGRFTAGHVCSVAIFFAVLVSQGWPGKRDYMKNFQPGCHVITNLKLIFVAFRGLFTWRGGTQVTGSTLLAELLREGQLFIHFFTSTLKCLHDRQGHRPTRVNLPASQGYPPRPAIFSASKRLSPGHPSRWAISVDLKPAKMVSPYKRGEYYRSVYFSKASAVKEDHSKSSDDKTRISREPDVEPVNQQMRKDTTSPVL